MILKQNGMAGILCECYNVPENTAFRLGGQYYCTYVIDGIKVYFTDEDSGVVFDDISFLHYFQIKDSLKPMPERDIPIDHCANCIRLLEFPKEMCTECNRKSVDVRLEGACLIKCCSHCGFTCIGASFFAACEQDNKEYRILLHDGDIEKRTLVKLARLLNYNVLELLQELHSGNELSKGCDLRKILSLLSFMEDNAIKYEIIPKLPYSKIRECTYWKACEE